jgi:thymidylate kinase
VRGAYLERAAAAPQRIQVINADQPLESIKNLIEETVSRHCK